MRARLALALLVSAMAALAGPAAAQTGDRWSGTWATSPHAVFPTPAAEQSMRMIVRTTVGGDRVRIRLSNVQGTGDVTFAAATVAVRERDAEVRPGVVALSFGGARSVTVHAGTEVLSDPAPMTVPAGQDLAVSFYVRGTAARVTAHTGARKTSWMTPAGAGDHTSDTSGAAYSRSTTSWLFLDEVLVASPAAGAIVGLGSSSVDGTGTTTDAEDRWSDVMSRRLQQRPACAQYGYLNEGVDADTFDTMLARIQRDVLPRAGVRYVILYGGSGNDIATGDSAEKAIAETRQIIDVLRAARLGVIGGTLIPREQATIPGQETERQKYNAWVRTAGAFDAVIDFEIPVRDPQRPDRFKPGFSSDGIHSGPEGNRLQGESIDLGIFDPAAACGPGSRPGGDSPRALPRLTPRLSVKVSPRRDRRAPYRFTTRGRLILPRGITASRACAGGRVSVVVKAGRNTISTRRARVRSDCSFGSRVSFAGARRFGRHHRLGVTVRFLGSQRLRRVTAQPRHVRV